jgi:hypothetical protein
VHTIDRIYLSEAASQHERIEHYPSQGWDLLKLRDLNSSPIVMM